MQPQDVVIRNAQHADIEDLVRLLTELFSIETDFKVDPARQRRGLRLMLDGCGKHRCVVVADAGGRVVGMGSVQTLISTAEGGCVGLIEDLVVAGDRRGQGIGRMLLTRIEAWAGERGLLRLQLLADAQNAPALRFYERQRWQPTALICLRKKERRSR